MDKLSTKLRLVRSQSMGVGMGADKGGVAPRRPAPEGRSASIVLLDERRLEMLIQPRLYSGELLDLVASHCQIKEKEYFGLAVLDDNGHYTWLQLDRKVLDHDLPRKPQLLTIHFLVKFFVESISHLHAVKTVEHFYLQARSLIFRGTLQVDSEIVFQLGALALQSQHGDYELEGPARTLIKKSPILPASVLKEHPSVAYCEDQVIEHYKKTKGQTRGQAMVNYMSIVESMPTYGVHYFEVYDKRNTPWWLGLSCRGIAQYNFNDRKVPVRVFQWKQLENLYFRDKKFSIEVHDAKRVVQTLSSFNLYEDALNNSGGQKDALVDAIADSTTQVSVSRRSFNPGNIHVYVWFGKTQSLTKCIWQSAISQHQFYLDRKQAKMKMHLPQHRTLKEIARDLTKSTASLSSASSLSNLSRSNSSHSLAVSYNAEHEEQSEEARRARMEMLAALRARREAVEAKLKEKNKMLKDLCIKEGELTGELPPEIPLAPGEPVPQIRRRVGTEFALSETVLKKAQSPDEEMLASLELEYEIQSQITSAALKLSNDPSASKSARKQRKVLYQQSQRKLRDIETKLNTLKRMHPSKRAHKKPAPPTTVASQLNNIARQRKDIRRGISVPDLENDTTSTNSLEEEDLVSAELTSPKSCPSSPRKHQTGMPGSPQRLMPRVTTGYIPSSVYLRSSYRAKQYPTLSSRPLVPTPDMMDNGRSATLPSPYRNKYEVNSQCDSPVGLYNIPQQRTSQAFSSLDDIDAMVQSPPTTRLEAAAYPSLERSARKRFRAPVAAAPPEPKPAKSMEDLDSLEASGVHGRSKMHYREVVNGTDEFPKPTPLPRTRLLPGQTYPEPVPKALPPISHTMAAGLHDVFFNSPPPATTKGDDSPPPLMPKSYHQVVEQRRLSHGLDRIGESPAVDRKMKPKMSSSSIGSDIQDPDESPSKFVPYRNETTKPFEMSDFYKYSTKYRKSSSLKSSEGADSDRSSTTSAGSIAPEVPVRPPEVPARVQTATVQSVKPPPVPPQKPESLADSFSSEMLAWYNKQQKPPGAAPPKPSNPGGKPATLV